MSTRTTSKSSALPPVPPAAANKTIVKIQTPGRRKSSLDPLDAPAPQFRVPDPSTINRAQIVPAQYEPPPEIPPFPQPTPKLQRSVAAESAEEKKATEPPSMPPPPIPPATVTPQKTRNSSPACATSIACPYPYCAWPARSQCRTQMADAAIATTKPAESHTQPSPPPPALPPTF